MDVNRGLSSAAMDHPWTAYLKVSCDGNESQAQSPLSPSVNLIRAALLHVAATSRKKKDVSFGVLDCAKQLPSKKTRIFLHKSLIFPRNNSISNGEILKQSLFGNK